MVRSAFRRVVGMFALLAAPAVARQSVPDAAAPQSAPNAAATVVQKLASPGADPVGSIYLADASADGHRDLSKLAPLAPETAFELWIEGSPPTREHRADGDPAAPAPAGEAQGWKLPVAVVSTAEVDAYVAAVRRLGDVNNEAMFAMYTLPPLIEQRATLLYYYTSLPQVRERLDAAIKKLNEGVDFHEVIKKNSEDEMARQTGGLFPCDGRGGNLQRYPLEAVLFDLQPGQTAGPLFDRTGAYVVHIDNVQKREGETLSDRIQARAITVRYSTTNLLHADERERVLAAVRLRVGPDRFRRVLPPAIQVPKLTAFGPDDIAPPGHPAQPLKQRSLDDARDNKVSGK